MYETGDALAGGIIAEKQLCRHSPTVPIATCNGPAGIPLPAGPLASSGERVRRTGQPFRANATCDKSPLRPAHHAPAIEPCSTARTRPSSPAPRAVTRRRSPSCTTASARSPTRWRCGSCATPRSPRRRRRRRSSPSGAARRGSTRGAAARGRGCCSRCGPGRSTACGTRSAAAARTSEVDAETARERRAPRPDDEAWSRLERERLEAALATIPDRERELIELAYFEGYTQSELATRLGLPLGTVKRRTFNALARLRAHAGGRAMISADFHPSDDLLVGVRAGRARAGAARRRRRPPRRVRPLPARLRGDHRHARPAGARRAAGRAAARTCGRGCSTCRAQSPRRSSSCAPRRWTWTWPRVARAGAAGRGCRRGRAVRCRR